MSGPCKAYQDLIADRVLGHLDPDQGQALELHIKTCPACADYQQALQEDHNSLLQFGEALGETMSPRMEACVAALTQAGPVPEQPVISIRRPKKMSLLIKLAAAAVITVGITLTTVFLPGPTDVQLTLQLVNASLAAENALFTGEQPIYIQNDITVYPTAATKEWGGAWLPMCSLKGDGKFRLDQLKLTAEEDVYTVIDQAWYDPSTGRFVRILEVDKRVIFGNAYDGASVFTAEWQEDGSLQVQPQALGNRFTAPEQPAQFFGLAAGMPSGLDKGTLDLITIEPETLSDGTAVQTFKVGTPALEGRDNQDSYWLFRVRDDDKTVAEKEFVVKGETLLLIRRVLSEPAEAGGINWDMRELHGRRSSSTAPPKAAINADMVQTDISVKHMIEHASFETYMLKQQPAWVDHMEIMDLNIAGPQQRMFTLIGRAPDKRHIVLVQSAAFKQLSQLMESGQINTPEGATLVCETANGFQVGTGAPAGTAKMLLQSAMSVTKAPPSKDCMAYGLLAPDQTFLLLAVNGSLTEEELKQLVNDLIPAKQYLEREK